MVDDLPLLQGKRLLGNARSDIARHADEQISGFRSTLDRATTDLDAAATYVTVNGQAVLNDARKSLDNRVNLILGHAMQTAGLFGVEVPHPDTLRTSRSFPPPEIVAVGTGVTESKQSLAGLGGGGEQYRPICDVHLVDESIRQAYVNLCYVTGRLVSVCPEPISFISPPPTTIRRYPHWWQAELACRLVNECRWDVSEVLSYSDAIDAVKLFDGSPGIDMKQFCSVLPDLFEEWRIWIRNQNPQPMKQGEIKPPPAGVTLPDGYCWWCDPQGVHHAYYCTPETVPLGWVRC